MVAKICHVILSLRSVQETIVTVLIGSEEEAFYIHPSVLSKSSDFFKAALKHTWIDDQEIKLPDDLPACFKCYACWLYSASTPCTTYQDFVHLYGYGETLIDSWFQDHIISCIVKRFRTPENGVYILPIGPTVTLIYDTTPPGSPIRRLVVDLWAAYGNPEILAMHKRWSPLRTSF